MADPPIKIEVEDINESERLFVSPAPEVATPARESVQTVVDLTDEDRVFLHSLKRDVRSAEVFTTLRAAFRDTIIRSNEALLASGDKDIARLKSQLQAAACESNGSDQTWFLLCAKKKWPNLLGKTKAVLDEEVKRAESLEGEFARPEDAAHFENILRLRRRRLAKMRGLVEAAKSYVVELREKSAKE